jgi:hypothetical protein
VADPELVIVGTGRSGSGYIAKVLNTAGVVCGHEQWWNPMGERTEGLAADSSFCAVADLWASSAGGYAGAIGHQVRHPLKVVASLAQLPDHGPFVGCRERVMGPAPADPLEAALNLYVGWNLACEQLTDRRWRVEDVDAALVVELAAMAGVDVDVTAAAAAVERVPHTINDHETMLTLDWDDLPALPVTSLLRAMAGRYGYL